eukprot:9485102-Pyramimonas_sp.AAC.1
MAAPQGWVAWNPQICAQSSICNIPLSLHLLINGTVGVAKQFDAVGLNHQAADREICNLKEELQELRVLKDGVSAALVGATSNGAADNKQ